MPLESESVSTANRQIARAAGTVMAAFVLSNLIGLVRGILIMRGFGTGAEMEAFNTANRLAETLFNLVAGGALASAFVPTFTGFLARKDTARAWQLASAIANLVLILLIIVSALSAIFAPQIVQYLLAPGFVTDPAKFDLTVQLLRVILPSVVIFGLSGLIMGILNANQVFLYPALAPSMYSVGIIFGVLVLSPGMGIFGLAWGTVLGAALHMLVQVPSIVRLKFTYQPRLGLEDPSVREVGRLMLPRLIGAGIVQLNFWVNTNLSSRQPEGSLTAITTAFTLMMMPQALIAQATAIASLPTFSAQVALGKLDEMRSSLASTLRAVLLLAMPASVGLVLLREPIIRLLYQGGRFGDHSTELVAWALLWYAAGLVGHCVVEIVSRAFYALHDTKTPVMVGVLAMTLNIIFSLLFSTWFVQIGWMPHGGLALANSLATALEMGILLIIMRHRLNGLQGNVILDAVWKGLTACLAMGGALYFWLVWSASRSIWLITLGGLFLGAAIYGVILVIFRIKEVTILWKAISRRILHQKV
ncbi:MAG: murein biosynthesis integral membrane protein MurJ [Leptolinea sp.]|jgi:putative peptidoglycan lipid II flippase|nr:murein biosynthesis integral membrane protein MurJ [Leptolinea sp.]